MAEPAEKLDESAPGIGAESNAAVKVPEVVFEELTEPQKVRLDGLERVIKKNIHGYIAVGLALKTIRDEKLYMGGYFTFEAYCRDKWELSRKVAYDKIMASDVAMLLAPEAVKPDSIVDGEFVTICDTSESEGQAANLHTLPNEAQSRKLAELPPEDRPEAWRRACQRGIENHGRVTAKTVAEIVAETLGKRTDEALARAKNAAKPSKKSEKAEFVDPAFSTALQNLLNEIGAARQRNWYGVPKATVVSALRGVLDAIEME